MTPEDSLKLIIGDLMFQLAHLKSEIARLQAALQASQTASKSE